MGDRNYAWREPKKAKKGVKKISAAAISTPSMIVEVVKKGKKKREVEEAER